MIPPLGKVPIRSPGLVDQPADASLHAMAPKVSPPLGPDWQRWFEELFRDVSALLGNQQDPAAKVAGVSYRFKSTVRLSMPQSALATLIAQVPKAFNANDTGLLIYVTDYNHSLEWDGTKFAWGPGDSGSGWTAPFLVAPTASGWHLCDGTAAVSYLRPDGSLATQDLPTTAGTYYRQ